MGARMEVIGDNGYEVIGALREIAGDPDQMSALADASPALASALSGKTFRKINSSQDFGTAAYLALPMTGGGSIATTVAFTLTAQPARAIKPDRMVIGSSLPGVSLASFFIANTNQFLQNTGAVPAECFSALAIQRAWDFTACSANSTITVNGTNNNASTNLIFGTVSGYTVGQ